MLKLRFKNNKHNAVWLVEPKVSVGRSQKNDLVVDDANVAEMHAEIYVDHEELRIKVLSPDHPVRVNEKQVTKTALLAVNDVVTLGGVQLQVVDPKQEPKAVPTIVRQEVTAWSLKANHVALANKVFNLGSETIVGRANDCDIVLATAHLSRRHAQLTVKDGLLFVKDLGSANGTYLNGKAITEARVKRGDELRFDTLNFGVVGPTDDLDKTSIRQSSAKPQGGLGQAKRPATKKVEPAAVRKAVQESMSSQDQGAQPEQSSSSFTGLTVVILLLAGLGYWLWQQGMLPI